MLRITTYHGSETKRMKLEGKLKGVWVLELEQSWKELGRDKVLVDLTDVEYVDTAGRYLLALMHGKGARFVAVSPMMKHLMAKIASTSKRICALFVLACLLAAVAPAAAQSVRICG